MDALIRQTVALEEHVHTFRNLIHLLSCQIILWGYCLVEYKTLFSVAIYGKRVCGHRPAEKHALANSRKIEVEEVKAPEAVKKGKDSTPTNVVVAINVEKLANGR